MGGGFGSEPAHGLYVSSNERKLCAGSAPAGFAEPRRKRSRPGEYTIIDRQDWGIDF